MIDHIEDDPTDPDMCIVYLGYGTANQIAMRRERASIIVLDRPPSAFVNYEPTAAPPTPKPLPTDPAAVAARVSEEESADE